MCILLQPLADVSRLVSSQSTTTIQAVVPAFNDLFDYLEEQEENLANHEIIQITAGFTFLPLFEPRMTPRLSNSLASADLPVTSWPLQ